MAVDLLEGAGNAEGRNNDINVLAMAKRALAKIFLDSVDFSSPFFEALCSAGHRIWPTWQKCDARCERRGSQNVAG